MWAESDIAVFAVPVGMYIVYSIPEILGDRMNIGADISGYNILKVKVKS